jgi:DNA polymerase-3 subunit gamma/tau
MYYLTYRPKTISELDNSQVQQKIENLLKSKDIPHAMLFVGPKGMGKTSTARIMAKALNCLENAFAGKGESIEPCNTCSNCLNITTGASPDVVEQDAASNRGIDEIRRLIREAAFAPMTGRYRVYIIDEAHMITTDAFNALLKTLEEPPKTVIFILATTNEEKVPKTIISRCVRIPFGHAKKEDIIHMLKRVAKAEKVTVPEDLDTLIATYSENSFRDAAKLLEELVLQKKLTLVDARNYLGVRARENLLEIMNKEPLSAAISWIEEFSKEGGNIKRHLEDMLQLLKEQLLLKSGVATDTPDIGYSITEITQLMKLLHEAYNSMKFSPIESLPLEIAVVEFYNLRKTKN